VAEPKPYSKEHRRAERRRIARLSRLPFLYEYSLRGRGQAFAAIVLQTLLVIAVVLVPVRLLTGQWLRPGVALLVLVVGFAVQALSRYHNARAGRT
jgi:hypothetical protein